MLASNFAHHIGHKIDRTQATLTLHRSETPARTDVIVWDQPDPLTQGEAILTTHTLRKTCYFVLARVIATDFMELTDCRYRCFLPELRGTTDSNFKQAATWAKQCSSIAANYAQHLVRTYRDDMPEDVQEQIWKLRKIATALSWMGRREFDDTSIAFTVGVAFHVDSWEDAHRACTRLHEQVDQELTPESVKTLA